MGQMCKVTLKDTIGLLKEPSQTPQLRRTYRGCHTPYTEMMTDGQDPKGKKGAICTGLTIWSKSNPTNACTQQTAALQKGFSRDPELQEPQEMYPDQIS